jgi:hypothetical protein
MLCLTWSHYMFAKVFRFSGRQPSTRLDFCTKSRSNWSYFYKKPIKMSIYSYSGLSESSFSVTLQIFTTAFGHNAITPATVIIVMTDNQIRHCYGISGVLCVEDCMVAARSIERKTLGTIDIYIQSQLGRDSKNELFDVFLEAKTSNHVDQD